MNAKQKVVMYESDDAASFKEGISGWVSSDGRYFGNDENLARYAGCTHKLCECGQVMERGWLKCRSCRDKIDADKFNALPRKKWEGEPLVVYGTEEYFFNDDDVMEYVDQCGENDHHLIICEPIHAPMIEDYACDQLPEDMYVDEIDPALGKLIAQVNEYIHKKRPILSWIEGKHRAVIEQPIARNKS